MARPRRKNFFVPGEGPVPCRGMIVGEAPGETEAAEGRPFVGASGRLLEEALASGGLSREDVYITNVYKTRPVDERGRNRKPTKDEIGQHADILWDEWVNVRPHAILALGQTARDMVLPSLEDHTMGATRGHWYRYEDADDLNDPQVMVTWHPSWVLQHGGEQGREQFFSDVAVFAVLAK